VGEKRRREEGRREEKREGGIGKKDRRGIRK